MINSYENTVATSLVGPRTKTLAEFEYKRILNKPLRDELYRAINDGDKEKVNKILDSHEDIGLGLLENRGFTKLLLCTAIESDNDELLEVLVHKGARIGGVLFTAVREGSYKCVKSIVKIYETLDMQDEFSQHDLGPSDCKYEGFITPLMMSLQLNNYDIIEYLITRGYKIEDPKYETYGSGIKNNLDIDLVKITRTLGIPLSKNQKNKNEFPKEHSVLFQINTYQALANPLYISYMYIYDRTKVNPLFELFQLSRTLRIQSQKDEEFKEEYHCLSHQCEEFAVDLMEQCRTFREIKILTDILPEFETRKKHIEIKNKKSKDLAFLNLAIKGSNDKLVAHPNSQLCLNMVLYKNIYTIFSFEPNWRDRSALSVLLYTLRHILLLPFLALIHIIAPCTFITRVLGNPMIKFMSHLWSMILFVVLLIVSSFQDMFDDDAIFRPSIPEWLIMVWLLGLIVQECKELWIQGRRRYFSQWWNVVTFVMVLLFTISYVLRLVAYGITGNWVVLDTIKDLVPSVTFQVILLANSLFSIAMVLSFIRLSAAFQANDKLGPLQLSLYHLILDVAKFMVFFTLIIVAFGFSLRKLYSHYISTQKYIARNQPKNTNSTNQETSHEFTDVGSGFNGLFWSLFGLTELQSFSTKNNRFTITKETGQMLFGLFQVLAVIIAINMLIAMMTRSFDDIADNAIKKWKVSRTRLWMFWVEKGSILPPPLNLIPNTKFIYRQFQKLCGCCKKEDETFDVNITDDITETPHVVTAEKQQEERNRKVKDILKRYIGLRKSRDNVENKNQQLQGCCGCCSLKKQDSYVKEYEEEGMSSHL